jgi:hypothetical protein
MIPLPVISVGETDPILKDGYRDNIAVSIYFVDLIRSLTERAEKMRMILRNKLKLRFSLNYCDCFILLCTATAYLYGLSKLLITNE